MGHGIKIAQPGIGNLAMESRRVSPPEAFACFLVTGRFAGFWPTDGSRLSGNTLNSLQG
jgi:hypothetical protein